MRVIHGFRKAGLLAPVVLACLLSACGSDSLDVPESTLDAGQERTSTPVGSDGGNSSPGPTEETVTIGETFWHSGFMVEIVEGTFAASEPDIFGDQEFTMTIEGKFTNLGPDQRMFDAPAALVTDAGAIPLSFSSDLPIVPGGGLTGTGEFVFDVDEDFKTDDAYLLIGEGDQNRAQVPLGPGGGEPIILEPTQPDVTGVISLELLDFTVTSADLRYDVPHLYREVDSGMLALTLNMEAVSRKSGNWSVFAQDFSLMSDGNAVGPDGTDLPNLPGSDAGVQTTGLYLRFLVDDPAAGGYTLRFTAPDRWVGADGVSEGTLEFELD